MDINNCQQYVTIIKDVITAGAALVAAYIGWQGLATWRKQLKGRTEYELARRLLSSIYKIRNYVSYFRNPFMSAGEIYQSMEREGIKAEFTDKDYDKMDLLEVQSSELEQRLSRVIGEVNEGKVKWGEIRKKTSGVFAKGNEEKAISSKFSGIQKQIVQYPAII